MSEELFHWKKVSFSEYLNKDGRIIKTLGFNLVGEVLILNINPIEYGSDKIATVSCVDGELYFVPFDSLIFLKERSNRLTTPLYLISCIDLILYATYRKSILFSAVAME